METAFEVGDEVVLVAHDTTPGDSTVYVVQSVTEGETGDHYGLLNKARVDQGLGPQHWVYLGEDAIRSAGD